MGGTFLGKWMIYMPLTYYNINLANGFASYEFANGTTNNEFCAQLVPTGQQVVPGKDTYVAIIQRDDGHLCFQLNNGQFVGYSAGKFPQVSTLDSATGFVFPMLNPFNPALTQFTSTIQSSADGSFIGFLVNSDGTIVSGLAESAVTPATFTRVTPWPDYFLTNSMGDGCDFAWVDLSWVDLEKVSLQNTDFSHCNLNEAHFDYSVMNGAKFTGANLLETSFYKCKLRPGNQSVDLSNIKLIGTTFIETDLTGANLTGATFIDSTDITGAIFVGAKFLKADLTHVQPRTPPQFSITPLAPPSATNPRTSLVECQLNQSLLGNNWALLDLTNATINNLSSPLSTKAKPLQASYSILTGLNQNSLSGLSIESAIFDYAVLDGLDFTDSDLTNASFKDASLHGTYFTGAILEGATMTGTQMGTLGRLFTLASSYENDLNAGPNVDAALLDQFAQNGITLSSKAALSILAASRVWQLDDEVNKINYTIRLENQTGGPPVLTVYAPATAANLVGAYMPNATLTGANLYGVSANNIQFYGDGSQALIDGSSILEEAQLNDSNLTNLNLTEAQLLGTNLSNSHLFNAKFNKANLTQSANGTTTNLSYCNLQGADFTDAQLYGANLKNAAVAINTPTTGNPQQGGVYLFSLPYSEDTNSTQAYTSELDAASSQFTLPLENDSKSLQDYIDDLEAGKTADFIIAFLNQQPPVHLSNSAEIETVTAGSIWQIVDGSLSYRVWLGLGMDNQGNAITELFVAPPLPITQAAFSQNGITLRWQASASIDKANQQWLIDNDSENPQNLDLGYVKFILILNDKMLDVYGTAIRIERLGDNNNLVIDTEECNVTTLSVTNMDGDTICPNGKKLSTNQTPTVKWDERWLRASEPPSPPTCVATDYGWCPQTKIQPQATKATTNESSQ